jgi:uncharacterized protein
MKIIKRVIFGLSALAVLLYFTMCVWFYFNQESILFRTVKLSKGHVFNFESKFEERYIPMPDGITLHGVLFRAKESKGLILWLPGGRGMIDSIGLDAHCYTDLNYDLFIINYRGFGKSNGKISSEKEFNNDMQMVYDYFRKEYDEKNIIIYGYSLGTGPAAALAQKNNPGMLILRAPYYSLVEMNSKYFPYLPISLLLKYKFAVYKNIRNVKCPVLIIHGDEDRKIPVEVAYRLKEEFKPGDNLLIIKNQGHDKFEKNVDYLQKIKLYLGK